MGFLSPLGLLALVALPLVVGLHMFRRRWRQRPVSALFLFAPHGLTPAAGRRRTPLIRSLSLLLELVAVVLLSLLLARFVLGTREHTPHLILVLDDSASMGATGPEGSFAAKARGEIEELLAAKGSNTQVTVILTGPRPRILAGPRCRVGRARMELDRWHPGAVHHDQGPALDLAREIANGSGDLHLFTDRPPAAPPGRFHCHATGEALPNAALLSGRRQLLDGQESIHLEAWAWGAEPVRTELVLRRQGQQGEPLARRRLTLSPGRAVSLRFALTPGRAPLVAELDADALTIDNRLVLLPERRGQVSYACTLPAAKARPFAQALAAAGALKSTDPTAADLVVRSADTATPGAGAVCTLVLHQPGESRESWQGPYLVQKGDDLLDGLDLAGVIWTAAPDSLPGQKLVAAGDQPLLTRERRRGVEVLHLNLDPAASNLTYAVAWPVLFCNLVASVRQGLPGPGPVNLQVGDLVTWRPRPGSGGPPPSLTDPAGRPRPGRGVGLLTWEADRPGLYTLQDPAGGSCRWSVNYCDPRESDLTGCDTASLPPQGEGETTGDEGEGRPEGRLLALLLLLVLVGDWWVLTRGAGRTAA